MVMAFFKSISATNEAVTIITSWALSADELNMKTEKKMKKQVIGTKCDQIREKKIVIKEELRKT